MILQGSGILSENLAIEILEMWINMESETFID